ncbi:cbb3-type cytochrome oxidase assembly protein CcoS [Povalibacter sp.]|uniref:cbb3-type cytochrome oxidase assembly protein CcoS n=1 Tax=Povalibacter sp. TaxID=1962978 RepID=UPI002F404DF9
MNIILIMIPLSIVLLAGAAAAFFWAVDNDQFDDMETPGLTPLDDRPDAVPRP